MNNIDDYNYYCFVELGKHVDTTRALVIQYDSWVIRPELWDDNWLNWDYLAAPWPVVENSYIANNGERARVGNGGFSLRSKWLMDIPRIEGWGLRSEQNQKNEDGQICCYWRKEFLRWGIKYAPVEVAARFSFENEVPENREINTFGFHKNIRYSWIKELGL